MLCNYDTPYSVLDVVEIHKVWIRKYLIRMVISESQYFCFLLHSSLFYTILSPNIFTPQDMQARRLQHLPQRYKSIL